MAGDRLVLRTGGQSGVDRACLDSALALGFRYRGWCPQGGWAEDLAEPPGLLARYPDLEETLPGHPRVAETIAAFPQLQGKPCNGPDIRTVMNVCDSDVVLTLTLASALADGTSLGSAAAAQLGKPERVVLLGDPERALQQVLEFLSRLPAGTVVDVNGPRESSAAGIYQTARQLLLTALAQLRQLPISSLEPLGLELVTHLGGEQQPFVTGVYPVDDLEREHPYTRRESPDLRQAKDTHQAMLATWNQAGAGICQHCQRPGWVAGEHSYCRSRCSEQPHVCLERHAEDPCPAHRGR